jgi:predicted amidophosphoribosyltransferase
MSGNNYAARALQTVFENVFPPQCMACNSIVAQSGGSIVAQSGGLCGQCWTDTHFISGLICDKCGTPLPGDGGSDAEMCDECLIIARPWDKGRGALIYKGAGRKLILGLKHGDRTDVGKNAGKWLERAASEILNHNVIVAPVPLHWTRFFKRRYNQSAILAAGLTARCGANMVPDLLLRRQKTTSLDGLSKEKRFETLQGAISTNPRTHHEIAGMDVLIVDDVMTSGATFAACAEACFKANAKSVCVLALARVVKDA